MPKLTEYPEAQSFDENDILIKDGVNGTKKIKASNAADYMGKNVIMVNEQPTEGTKVVVQTTGQEYSLALMSDVNSVAEEVADVKTQLKDINDTLKSPNLFNIGNVYCGINLAGTLVNTISKIDEDTIRSNWGAYGEQQDLYNSEMTLPAGTYTMSAYCQKAKDSGEKTGVRFGYRDLSTNAATYLTFALEDYQTWQYVTYTFTLLDETAIRLVMQQYGSASDYTNTKIEFKNIMLVTGSKPIEYARYGTPAAGIEKRLETVEENIETIDTQYFNILDSVKSLNLFDISKVYCGANLAGTLVNTISKIDEDTIRSNYGTYGETQYLYDSQMTLSAGTYTMSAYCKKDAESGSKASIKFGYINKANNQRSAYVFDLHEYQTWQFIAYTFTLSEETTIVLTMQGAGGSGDYTNLKLLFKDIMLVAGNEPKKYVRYGEPIPQIAGRIETLEEHVFNLPSYWINYLNEKIPTVCDKSEICALNGDSFIFLTDYHLEGNRQLSHNIISEVLAKTSIDKFFFGGDAYNGDASHSIILEKARKFMSYFSPLGMLGIRGNHESNLIDGGSQSVKLDDTTLYAILIKKQEPRIIRSEGLYYCVDNLAQKIRYIILDTKEESTHLGNDQKTWFAEKLTELESGWGVIVLAHQMILSNGNLINYAGVDIDEVINSTIGSMSAEFIAVVCGHIHNDVYAAKENYLVISTACDAYLQRYQSMGNGVFGTISEQLFDIYSIDRNNHRIYTTRIGAGNDRVFDYKPSSETYGLIT